MSTKQWCSSEQWTTKEIQEITCYSATSHTAYLNMRSPGIELSPCGENPASALTYGTAFVCTHIPYNIPTLIEVTTAFSPVFPPLNSSQQTNGQYTYHQTFPQQLDRNTHSLFV